MNRPEQPEAETARRWRLRGTVQGVGFRPFVARLATGLGLRGEVGNDGTGVFVVAAGTAEALEIFAHRLQTDHPPAARLTELTVEPLDPAMVETAGFAIATSTAGAETALVIPPDLATCPDCRRELRDPGDRRHRYPFINCTQCGPRYSIVASLPYDRARTAMAGFTLCRDCAREYTDPADRRYHAEPNACPVCGPQLAWDDDNTNATREEALEAAITALRAGRIVALKGLGGYQLLCRADDEAVVGRLRERKRRPRKPFALMVRDLEAVDALVAVDGAAAEVLTSAAGPIVPLPKRAAAVAAAVAPGLDELGVMLPTTGLHVLLANALPFPLVCTSGNLADEPICTDDAEARGRLGQIADGFLSHDRPILRPVDDSVVQIVAGRPQLLRCARGYAPRQIGDNAATAGATLQAVGGHLKNAVALIGPGGVVLGPHVGDMETTRSEAAFHEHTRLLRALLTHEPTTVACDLHPDYATTRFAEATGMPLIRVQHHHAHVLAVLTETDDLTIPALGFPWDGTGYGIDSTVWGGEVLRVEGARARRVGSLRPFPLYGGDAAIREPWRVALALLAEVGDPAALTAANLAPLGSKAGAFAARFLGPERASRTVPGSVPTTSMGRLFDGVAALLGLVTAAGYEAEGAILLEQAARRAAGDLAPYPLVWAHGPAEAGFGAVMGTGSVPRFEAPAGAILRVLDWRPMIADLVDDRKAGVPVEVIAARFHATLVAALAVWAADHPGLRIILTGGCFQNKVLAEAAGNALAERAVQLPWQAPPGDGGLALGQLAAAQLLSPTPDL